MYNTAPTTENVFNDTPLTTIGPKGLFQKQQTKIADDGKEPSGHSLRIPNDSSRETFLLLLLHPPWKRVRTGERVGMLYNESLFFSGIMPNFVMVLLWL